MTLPIRGKPEIHSITPKGPFLGNSTSVLLSRAKDLSRWELAATVDLKERRHAPQEIQVRGPT